MSHSSHAFLLDMRYHESHVVTLTRATFYATLFVRHVTIGWVNNKQKFLDMYDPLGMWHCLPRNKLHKFWKKNNNILND